MRQILLLTAAAVVLSASSVGLAAEISGEYLEARSCDVYTGPCFANAEMGLAGKDALMAWKVDQGSWKGVSLDGLKVALVLKAEGTLGYDGIFPMKAGKIKSVILVDEKASPAQRIALVQFVKDTAQDLTKHVVKIQSTPMKLENNHLDGKGIFEAGKLAKIETRALKADDCVCTNEVVYYQPLTKVDNFSPAYSKTLSFQGDGLNNRWTTHHIRSAFLATFRK
jgi:hypothetical protein